MREWTQFETAIRGNGDNGCKWVTSKELNTKLLECSCKPNSLNADFPTITMQLGVYNNMHEFTIDPSMYMLYENRRVPGDYCQYNNNEDYSNIKTCTVGFTSCDNEDNKWILGSLFNRAHFSMYEVRAKHSRIGFLDNGSRILPSIILADISDGAIIWILLSCTLGFIFLLICFMCMFRACCSEKSTIIVPPIVMPPKKPSPVEPFIDPISDTSTDLALQHGDNYCHLCGKNHIDMCRNT